MAEFLGTLIAGRFDDGRSLNVSPQHLGGHVQIWRETYTADVAQGDTVVLGYLPWNITLTAALSEVQHTAFGTSVVLDIGFRNDAAAGVSAKTAVLANDLDVATAGTKSLMASVAIGDRFKKLWELAGLSAAPKGLATIIATFGGANPASGTIAIEQGYVGE